VGRFCDMYSPNTEKDRELRLLCDLHGKDYDRICYDIDRKKRIEKVAEEKLQKLMELFKELHEVGVGFNGINDVGVNINGVTIGYLVDSYIEDKPVYLERF